MGRVAIVIGLDSFRFELKGLSVQWEGDESIKERYHSKEAEECWPI